MLLEKGLRGRLTDLPGLAFMTGRRERSLDPLGGKPGRSETGKIGGELRDSLDVEQALTARRRRVPAETLLL
jgi:hypothetical protein